MEIQNSVMNNRKMFEQAFNYPTNKDIVFRDFIFQGKEGFVIYIDGMADGDKISDFILRPLLNKNNFSDGLKSVLQISSLTEETNFSEAVSAVLQGDCALCIEGISRRISVKRKALTNAGLKNPRWKIQ